MNGEMDKESWERLQQEKRRRIEETPDRLDEILMRIRLLEERLSKLEE